MKSAPTHLPRHLAGLLLAGLAAMLVAPSPALSRDDRQVPEFRPTGANGKGDAVKSFPDGITAHIGITYSTIRSYRPMRLDLYLPPAARRPHSGAPLVLFIHGGGWVDGNRREGSFGRDLTSAFALIASEGIAVASIDYRLSGEAIYPAQLQDTRAALRFLKAHAGEYGIDPEHSGAWGQSAGGQIAAALAVSCGDTGFDTQDEPAGSECVQAAVGWFGAYDIPALFAHDRFPAFILEAAFDCKKGNCSKGALDRASPITQVDSNDPPMLLIHGTGDTLVPVEQSRTLEAKLRAAGVPVETLYVEGANHGLRQATREETQAAFARALNATIDFFHAKLGAPES